MVHPSGLRQQPKFRDYSASHHLAPIFFGVAMIGTQSQAARVMSTSSLPLSGFRWNSLEGSNILFDFELFLMRSFGRIDFQ